jgi:pimeloyl-ACP methyl ester carboxylesterase
MKRFTYATNRTRRLRASVLLCLMLAAPATANLSRAPVPGGTLEYEIRGDGEAVLLIHGAHVAGSFLAVMDEPVLADFSLIRYHRRGYAGSAPVGGEPSQWIATASADAAALLRRLDVDRAHVVGHSSGGLIAMQLALDAPELVHSLILLEPAMMAALAATEDSEPHAVDANAPDTLAPGAEQYLEDDAGVAGCITRPVLNMVGLESGPYHFQISGFVTTWFSASEMLIVPELTHAIHMQDPAEVAASIAGFANRHPME